MRVKKCAWCGRQFIDNRKYVDCCSTMCRIKRFKSKQTPTPKVEKKCPICKKLFDANTKSTVYCSDKCRKEGKKKRDREVYEAWYRSGTENRS